VTLDAWMSARDMTDGAMAEALRVSREYVRLLRAGRRRPSLDLQRRIVRATQGAVEFAEDMGDGAVG